MMHQEGQRGSEGGEGELCVHMLLVYHNHVFIHLLLLSCHFVSPALILPLVLGVITSRDIPSLSVLFLLFPFILSSAFFLPPLTSISPFFFLFFF